MSKVAILAAALALAPLLAAFAQETTLEAAQEAALGVDAAVKLAVANNLSLKSGRITLGKAARARNNVWNAWLPSIDASVAFNRFNEEPSVPGLSPWYMAFQVEASLPLSLAKVESVKATVLSYESGQIDYETAEKQLERDVRKAFYGLLLSRESIRLAEQQLATAEKQYQKALKNFQAGLTPRLDTLTAQVAAENLKPALEGQRVSYATSLMSFQLLLGLEPAEQLTLKGTIEAEASHFEPIELSRSYMSGRLDVKSLEKQIEIMENRKRLQTSSAFTPTLSASASYAPTINDPFAFKWSKGSDWTDNGKLSLALMIPLDGFIPGSEDRVAAASAQDDIENARIALQQVRQKADVEIKSAVLALEKSLRTMQALELNVARAQEAYDLTETSYNAGTVELLEVQNASDELQKANLLLLTEKYTYLSGLIDLSYSLNTPLSDLKEKHGR
jgi:multidrug efflux system outer membrane protein